MKIGNRNKVLFISLILYEYFIFLVYCVEKDRISDENRPFNNSIDNLISNSAVAYLQYFLQVILSFLLVILLTLASWYVVWRLVLHKIPFFQEIFGQNKNKKKKVPQELLLTKGKHATNNYSKTKITPQVFHAQTPTFKPIISANNSSIPILPSSDEFSLDSQSTTNSNNNQKNTTDINQNTAQDTKGIRNRGSNIVHTSSSFPFNAAQSAQNRSNK